MSDNSVISTRVRLARNLKDFPFPCKLSPEGMEKVIEKVRSAVKNSNSSIASDFKFIKMSDLTEAQCVSLVERRIVSPEFIGNTEGRALLVNSDESLSIMINEEDHIRIQAITKGLALEQTYDLVDKLDTLLDESLDFAFSEKLGYLTQCPTNLGTGMRASVMMHLPALTMTENINRVISSAGSLGIEVRGLYGEGTKAYGNLYQISNRITLGLSESQVIEKLTNVVNQIVDMETKARNMLKEKNYDVIADRLFRSYGTLKYARSVSSSEAKSLLSDVMLGQSLGIIPKESKIAPLECMVLSEPALVCDGKELSPNERDKKRAELIRNNI